MKVRHAILACIFVLSVGFFWLAINEYLIQSKAQLAGDFQVVPHARSIECHPKGECYLHILGSTATTNAVAGVTGKARYSLGLDPVRLDSRGLCRTSSYGLDSPLQFAVDPVTRTVTFSVGALKADNKLIGGNACITTLVFKPTDPLANSQDARLALTSQEEWKAGGLIGSQKSIFKTQIETQEINVKIDFSVPLPSDEPTPTGPLPSPAQCTSTGGDCNCDSSVDLVDWELLRASMKSEGPVCDMNDDGASNALDVTVWLKNVKIVSPINF